jgi:hypothetical protein
LFALHLLVIGLGLGARAMDRGGRTRLLGAALVLAATALSHIVFGYAAFVSLALLAVVGPRHTAGVRLVRLFTIAVPALLLLAWFVVPLVQASELVNHSRWEDPRKWDSYGARFILTELLAGRLLDFGRWPSLSLLVALGTVAAIVRVRHDTRAQRLLGLCGCWLVLFFGRETWGSLMLLAGVPADLHLHRLQAVFELSAVLLGAFGTIEILRWMLGRTPLLAGAACVALATAVISIGVDRAGYLEQNEAWGDETLAAYAKARPDLEAAIADARAIVSERPGRVAAGQSTSWGGAFTIGSAPVYSFLTRHHLDQVSFLYHSMSKTSDIMVLRDEASRTHDVVFGIRAVVAPADRTMPGHMTRRSTRGHYAVYESSPEGYFGIVDVAAHYVGPASTRQEASERWLTSALPPAGLVISLDPRVNVGPALERWKALPNSAAANANLVGRIISETKTGEQYNCRIEVNQPAYAFIKITWSPDLVATVDGRPAPVIHVTPGFGVVPVPAGQHDVSVAYRPGPLKPLLLLFGVVSFGLVWRALAGSRVQRLEVSAAALVGAAAGRVVRPAFGIVAVLAIASIVALHPLFRGKLIAGHDAAEYPPRIVEFSKVIREGHVPPIWAPDLSSGHGQPLFGFSPPFPYVIALPFRAAGAGLTNAIQWSVALLLFCGAAAIYGIGRRLHTSASASLGGAIAWLFGPYLSLDLFVRAAFSEAVAIAVAPLALLALLNVLERPTFSRIALAAASVALIQLSHNAVALLLVPVFVLIALVCGGEAFQSAREGPRLRRLAPLVAAVAAIGGGLGLTAFFWWPSIAEISYLHTPRLLEGTFDWTANLVFPRQLFSLGWGYGFSVPGPGDGMSFALGPAHLVLGLAGMAIAWRSPARWLRTFGLACGILAISGTFLTTTWASPLWSHLPLLHYSQVPWRALLIPGLFFPLLAVLAFERSGPRGTMILVAVLVAINLPHTEAQGFLTYDDEYFAPESIAAKGINTTTHEEFEPRWSQVRPPYSPQPLTGITSPIQVSVISNLAARRQFNVSVPAPTMVESSIFYYPGWEVRVDGALAAVTPHPTRGTMQFAVPAGRHTVAITLYPTAVRRLAFLVSLVTLVLLATGVAVEWATPVRRRQPVIRTAV